MRQLQDPLRILLVEDTTEHLNAGIAQLNDALLFPAENYEEAISYIMKGPTLDVVLTDLMMPKGGTQTMNANGMEYIYDLLPYGFPIALAAAKRGIPYIGIVTDVNHHDHPMSACIDQLSSAYWDEQQAQTSLLQINESRVGIFHAPFTSEKTKDWKKVLEVLMR